MNILACIGIIVLGYGFIVALYVMISLAAGGDGPDTIGGA